jgi:acetylornithine/succinyldiaminopimelate/putrescine aminotransferase
MDKQSITLQQKIERTASKLAALKAQAQARDAREKARSQKVERKQRTRGLLLLGIALEREMRDNHEAPSVVRDLIEKHLTRLTDRETALRLLSNLMDAQNEDIGVQG